MFEGVGRRSESDTGSFVDIGQHSLNGYEKNVLYRNNGDQTFTDVATPNGADRIEDGRGVAALDADRDGRMDLALRNYLQPSGFLRNRGKIRNWVAFELVGHSSNRDAIGARIRLTAGDRSQSRAVHAGSGFLSSSSRRQHFGLADQEIVQSVEITWPSGHKTTLADLHSNRTYRVEEDATLATSHQKTIAQAP
jgi:hypothetical protein